MHTPHRRAFVTRLAFHFLWMGIACTGMPALALCIVRHRVTSYDIFLKVLHDQWLLWMHLAGIGLLIAGIALIIWAGILAGRADDLEAAQKAAAESPGGGEAACQGGAPEPPEESA